MLVYSAVLGQDHSQWAVKWPSEYWILIIQDNFIIIRTECNANIGIHAHPLWVHLTIFMLFSFSWVLSTHVLWYTLLSLWTCFLALLCSQSSLSWGGSPTSRTHSDQAEGKDAGIGLCEDSLWLHRQVREWENEENEASVSSPTMHESKCGREKGSSSG